MTNDKPNLPVKADAPDAYIDAPGPGGYNAAPSITRTHPAAESLAKIGQVFARDLTAADMVESLRSAMAMDADGEAVLFEQAQVLDSLFHRLIYQSLGGRNFAGEEQPEWISSSRIDLALRTQKQCRTTIDALNAVKTMKRLSGDKKMTNRVKDD